MEQSYKRTELFLTHTWRADLSGRDNHSRVALINMELNHLGYTTWFDTQRMEGKIQDRMKEGVDYTNMVLVFVTEEYLRKINAKDENDNCFFEFDRAITQKTEKNMLCVVMDKKYENPNDWFGYLKEKLGNCLFVSMSGDFSDNNYFNTKIEELELQLNLKGVKPSQLKKACTKCKIVDEKNNSCSFYLDGTFCTNCASLLQESKEPKYYCVDCNIHCNGQYCYNCKQNLLDEEKKIQEIEDQYKKAVLLKLSYDTTNYSHQQSKYEELVEKIRNDIEKLCQKREKAKKRGEVLELNEESFSRKVEELRQVMATLVEKGSMLPISSSDIGQREPIFDELLKTLDDDMKKIMQERREISKICRNMTMSEKQCEENVETMESCINELKDIGAKVQPKFKPNEGHTRSCACEICTFHEELKVNLGKQTYFTDLIKNNNVERLRLAISLENCILEMKFKENNRIVAKMNPFMYAVRFGQVEMLNMLIKMSGEGFISDPNNQSLLHIAVEDTREEMAKFLCSNFPEMLNTPGWNPFVNNKMVQLLISNNAHELKQKECKDILAKHSLYPNMDVECALLEQRGFSFLEDLADLCEDDIILALINQKEEVVEMRSEDGKTLLHLALNKETIHYLCENFGETLLAVKDAQNLTPLMAAYKEHNFSSINELKKYACVPDQSHIYEKILNDIEIRGNDYIVDLVRNKDLTILDIITDIRKDLFESVFHSVLKFGTLSMLEMLKEKYLFSAGGEMTVHETFDSLYEETGKKILQDLKSSDEKSYIQNIIKDKSIVTLHMLIDMRWDLFETVLHTILEPDNYNDNAISMLEMLTNKGADVYVIRYYNNAYANKDVTIWLDKNYPKPPKLVSRECVKTFIDEHDNISFEALGCDMYDYSPVGLYYNVCDKRSEPRSAPITTYTAMHGTLHMLQLLEQWEAYFEDEGFSALIYAMHNHEHGESIVAWLCENCPELLNSKNTDGYTPLHYLISHGERFSGFTPAEQIFDVLNIMGNSITEKVPITKVLLKYVCPSQVTKVVEVSRLLIDIFGSERTYHHESPLVCARKQIDYQHIQYPSMTVLVEVVQLLEAFLKETNLQES